MPLRGNALAKRTLTLAPVPAQVEANVPEKLIQERTGHRSVAALR